MIQDLHSHTYYSFCGKDNPIEHIDLSNTTVSDIFEFKKALGCRCAGIAHTDLPAFLRKNNISLPEYFGRMAEENIFWELNVNLDSVHSFREHKYVEEFFADKELQEIILKSGMRMSIGFDGHRAAEYKPERVQEYCRRLSVTGIPLAFSKD